MRSRLLAVAAGSATLVLAAGCSGSSSSGGTTAAPPTSGASPTPSPSQSQSQQPIPGADPELSSIVLTTAEVARSGVPVNGGIQRGGLSVTHQKTLDECHATYPSEAKRMARVQAIYLTLANPQGAESASNEVVRYGKGGAAQAYAEITHSLHHCPAHFTEGGKAVGSHTTVEAGDPDLTHDQITATQMVTIKHHHVWTAITFMYDGDLFSGVYVFRPTRAAALAADRTLSRLSATKLKAAFASEGTQV